MAYEPSTRMLFCDWHMPNFLPEVTLDFDDYFAGIQRTGAETLIFQAKTAHGGSFFPTEVGITNPAMKGDIFGEVCHRTKALGLEFIAYYNMVLSWDLGRLHPEWSQIGRDGRPLRMFLYPCQCMSNRDFADYVAEHMAEATRKYPIDGWFLDLQYFSPEGCFCPACAQRFATEYGYELEPDAFGVEQWLDFYAYQVRRREWFIHHAQKRCNQERAGLSWSWNGCGNPAQISATLPEGADYLSTEAHPPAYLHADLVTRFCEGLRRPFTLFMPESQGSWGDWTVTTPETIKGLSASALAHGGALNINHVPYPCGDRGGRVPGIVWDTITEVFGWVAERAELCSGRRPVPVIATLHSAENNRLLCALGRTEEYAHLGHEQHAQEQAVTQLLCETHACWEVRAEDLTLDEMRAYELLIIPFLPYVSADLADRLREYVRGGGRLLASWETSLFGARGERLENFALADLFGVDLTEVSGFSVCYLDQFADVLKPFVPDMPLLIKDSAGGALNPKNHALYCTPRAGAQTLAHIMDPVVESDFEGGRYVYHDHAPPGYWTDRPAIVRHPFGAGEVIYLPVPFFKGYASKASPFLRELFRALLEEVLGVSAQVRITAPVSIKSALMADEEGWLLHLIHVQKQTDAMYLDRFHRADPIDVRVRPGWPVAAAQDALTGADFAVGADGDWSTFTVPGVTDHTIVRIRRG